MTDQTISEKEAIQKEYSDLMQQDIPLPEPTLITLVSGLASQAMISLGVFPNPINGSTHILLNQGQHLIETITMLAEKTKGNQTANETATIDNVLHELRMIFVHAQNEQQRRNQAEQNSKTD